MILGGDLKDECRTVRSHYPYTYIPISHMSDKAYYTGEDSTKDF